MRRSWMPLAATVALPLSFAALLVLGAVAAALRGHLGPVAVLLCAAVITAAAATVAEPATMPLVLAVAWLTVSAFSKSPYAQLQTTGHRAWLDVVVLAGPATAVMLVTGALRWATRPTRPAPTEDMDGSAVVDDDGAMPHAAGRVPDAGSIRDLAVAVSRRRQAAAVVIGAVLLPVTTLVLTAVRPQVSLDDDLLLYLLLVVVVTLVGGFTPAVVAAVTASLLLNWFFTPPLHNWTIDSPQNLVALLLFVTVAVTVSSVVHLAARRAAIARRSQDESNTLLSLARTVLGGHDTATDVVEHLAQRQAIGAELQECVAGHWVRIAASGVPDGHDEDDEWVVSLIRADLRLRLFGVADGGLSLRTVEGYGAQAAAALDRERLRVQAAQAEILGAGNRMRTALLAAVSHDLRTPLSAVKASVSSLRQRDVTWSAADQMELLATIEENADRLDGLIANLLDMSRIHTGSLQPLLRPVSLEEIAPLALRGLDGSSIRLDLPDRLPLVTTDPGLLERAIANLLANALRYSPARKPPMLRARTHDTDIHLDIVDHGPGVEPDAWDTMFLPFQQLGDRRNASGVGLGLAVARGFVEATGGTLTAHTTPGGGLTMRIRLAAAAAAETPAVTR